MVPDAVLLVRRAERDGGDHRASLWVWLRSYVDGTRAEAIKRDVLLDGVDAVRPVRVVRGISVENDRRHDAEGR